MRKTWSDVLDEGFGEVAYREILIDSFDKEQFGLDVGNDADLRSLDQLEAAIKSLGTRLAQLRTNLVAAADQRAREVLKQREQTTNWNGIGLMQPNSNRVNPHNKIADEDESDGWSDVG